MTPEQQLALAERIVRLRDELAAAELQFYGKAVSTRPGLPIRKSEPVGPSVAQQARDVLAKGPADFGALVLAVGGRQHAQAVRAMLKKERAAKRVKFAGGKYSWVAK